jgi:hypothetical protein
MRRLIRKSDIFLAYVLLQTAALGLMLVDAAVRRSLAEPVLRQRAEVVRVLGLTDLALFTEARYTRNPSLADRHSPFQEHPLSLEHFPSGSVVSPPFHLTLPAGR